MDRHCNEIYPIVNLRYPRNLRLVAPGFPDLTLTSGRALRPHRRQDLIDDLLRITEQHQRVLFVEQRIIDSRISRRHRAFHDYRVAGFPDVEHRHAGYG